MAKDYENMGIYDLRNYARSMGVHSPTTLKRDELIDRINEIINGREPDPKTTNRGRPPKHKPSDEYLIEFVLPSNLNAESDLRYKPIMDNHTRSNIVGLLSESFVNSSADKFLFKGFYEEQTDDYGIACYKGYVSKYSRENTFVLKHLAERYQLKNGDYIVGYAKYIPEKNICVATEIDYVNDIIAIENFERVNYEDIIPNYPTEIISLRNKNKDDFYLIDKIAPLTKGSRCVINVQNQNKKLEIVKHILNAMSIDNNLRTLLISIDDSPEDIGAVIQECPDVEVCKLNVSQTRAQYFEKVFMYVKNCTKRVEFGQDVAIVLYNSKSFVDALAENMIISQNISENVAKVMATTQLKDLFNLSVKAKNGSLTFVLFDAQKDFEESANCVLNFDAEEINQMNLSFDIENSYNKNLDRIIGEEKFKNIQEIKKQIKNIDRKKIFDLI